mmetsp:Transcript_125227/g.217024  ORF Transcript_125227/g.217024 Transcript_125227/m.217024 type:complete len:221 (-) Transcript_125227:598-1260(-)
MTLDYPVLVVPVVEKGTDELPQRRHKCAGFCFSWLLKGCNLLEQPCWRSCLWLRAQSHSDVIIGLVDVISEKHTVHIGLRYGPKVDHCLPVDDLLPVLLPKQDNWQVRPNFASLLQGDSLKQFVEGAETAREHDDALCLVHHPKLAGEEIVEFERKLLCHKLVQALLKWEGDSHPHALSSGDHRGALVGSLHDAGTPTGANHDVLWIYSFAWGSCGILFQ